MSQTTVTIADLEEAAPAERTLSLSVIGGLVSIQFEKRTCDPTSEFAEITETFCVAYDELSNALGFLALNDENMGKRPDVPTGPGMTVAYPNASVGRIHVFHPEQEAPK